MSLNFTLLFRKEKSNINLTNLYYISNEWKMSFMVVYL